MLDAGDDQVDYLPRELVGERLVAVQQPVVRSPEYQVQHDLLIGKAKAGYTSCRRIEAEPGMDRGPNSRDRVRVVEPSGFERGDQNRERSPRSAAAPS